jgi:dinuclear metal center YbgI/SA1388 family protein
VRLLVATAAVRPLVALQRTAGTSSSLRHVPDVPVLADVAAVLDALYDPSTAEEWDAVGLVTGDPDQPVRRVLFAVDPVDEVISEAVEWGADLLVTHHPLLLRGVHSVSTDHPKGRLVTTLVRAGIALQVAHTNADVARPGVSDALADLLGIEHTRPLRPIADAALDKVVVFVPQEAVEAVVDAMASAGAGRLGDYERAAFMSEGTGTFLPLPGATPTVGRVGAVERVGETRLEMVAPPARVAEVVEALRAAHPYEEPAFDVLLTRPVLGDRGLGRVGQLAAPETLRAFGERVASALPPTGAGVRVAGHLNALVQTVAVCGGAGDDLFDDVRRAGADVFVTADLRHHPASEALAYGAPALVDCAHWATEWPWLGQAAARVSAALTLRGTTVETRVSHRVTDPWSCHLDGTTPISGEPL